jgi:hypothetical protein
MNITIETQYPVFVYVVTPTTINKNMFLIFKGCEMDGKYTALG